MDVSTVTRPTFCILCVGLLSAGGTPGGLFAQGFAPAAVPTDSRPYVADRQRPSERDAAGTSNTFEAAFRRAADVQLPPQGPATARRSPVRLLPPTAWHDRKGRRHSSPFPNDLGPPGADRVSQHLRRQFGHSIDFDNPARAAAAGRDLPQLGFSDAPFSPRHRNDGLSADSPTLDDPLRYTAEVDEPRPDDEPLPPLDAELWWHGGSYLYEPEGDKLNWPASTDHDHHQELRLPESWQKPRPATLFQEFLGADPVHPRRGLTWFGRPGFQWEPRFVGYGSYELFGIALEQGRRRQDLVGHQLLVDLDLRITGTERAHVQFRPLGRKNTGGSFYQFSDPEGYEDNSTLEPDRFWIEGELYSIFGGLLGDPFTPRDYHFVLGQFPFALHNSLLINDDILGFVVSKNTIRLPPLSNLNVQLFAALDEVDAFEDASADLYGLNATADYRLALLEATYAWLHSADDSGRNAHYAAASGTQFFGPLTLAGRVLAKWQDESGRGDGQLYVVESNFTRSLPHACRGATGVEYCVFYANAFKATKGWNSISGGNFDRLRSTFEVDPLVTISRMRDPDDTLGAAVGVQLFRRHEDESIIPEVAYEQPSATAVWGVGLRYLRKLGPRTFLEGRAVRSWSDEESLEREGVFLSTTVLF